MSDDVKRLTPRETMELHELLAFKAVCMTKYVMMQTLVNDHALKSLLQNNAEKTSRAIRDLQRVLHYTPELSGQR